MRTLPLTMRGEVVIGYRLARAVGFPTANIQPFERLDIPEGTYLGWTKLSSDDRRLPSLIFYGRPYTIEGVVEPRIEAHLLGENCDLYGQVLDIELISFVRPNEDFPSDEKLAAAINKDFEKALKYFNV